MYFLKTRAIFPFMSKLREMGYGHTERINLLHKFLILYNAPGFGKKYEESEIGEFEEKDRIRKWDEEAMQYYENISKK